MVEECRNGDKEALNLFYLRFAPRMLSIIRRYIQNEKDAEDVLHDGFIVGLTRLDSLRDTDKVELWLATIMKNLSLQFLQAQDMAKILYEIPDVEDAPDVDDILDLTTIERLIEKLPPGYQKVFRLAILENKSHKEIGKLLGIAPNSSSSQLFHAKLMMRKLITEYKKEAGLGCILIMLVMTGIFLWNSRSVGVRDSEILIAKTNSESIDNEVAESAPHSVISTPNSAIIPPVIQLANANPVKDNSVESESGIAIASQDQITEEIADTVENKEIIRRNNNEDFHYANSDNKEIPENYYTKSKKAKGWSINVGADTGLLAFNPSSTKDEAYMPPVDTPSDGDDPPNDKDEDKKLIKGSPGYEDYNMVPHTNYLPISFAITASRNLNEIFSVETGIRYTYLHSKFESYPSQSHCHWHYAGIPVKLNIKIYTAHRLRLYAGIGGSVDIPMYSNADVSTISGAEKLKAGRFNSPVVWSLSGNCGISFRLSRKIDIFLEPTLQYHFDQDYTVPNIWTDNKWGFSIPIGFRFNM